MIVQVCVGSSCHLKGSEEIVRLFEKAIEEYRLEDELVLIGSFCLGKCSRIGVTVQVEDDVYVGVTKDGFKDFFKEHILDVIEKERK